MSLDECFEKGMLKRSQCGNEEIAGSLNLARNFLEKARGNLSLKYFDITLLLAYNSMFHSARALLFKKGMRERSHFCMIAFLKQEFRSDAEVVKSINILDSYRIARHGVQYGGHACSELDANEAIADAEEFLKLAEKRTR